MIHSTIASTHWLSGTAAAVVGTRQDGGTGQTHTDTVE